MIRLLQKKRFYAMLLFAAILLLFLNSNWLSRMIYPIKYKENIREYAEEHGVDPILIAAIIRVESNFKPDKVSKKKAFGLMQLMPETAEWIMEQSEMEVESKEDLKRANVNIRMGAWYLQYLFDQFSDILQDKAEKDQIAIIAAAYNAGPGNVEKWLEANVWDGTLKQVSDIPFGETRHYIQRIMYYYSKFRSLYADEFR